MSGFWIFMCLIVLLIPFTVLYFGRLFLQRSPDKINAVFGYRTSRSMKNRDTWEFAHRSIGKIWLRTGTVLLPLSAAAMLAGWGRDTETVGLLGGVVVGIQTILLVLTVIPVERALKKNFDETGQRKQSCR